MTPDRPAGEVEELEAHAKALRDYSDTHCKGNDDCPIPHEAIDVAIDALRRLREENEGRVPEGFRLVPVEPTEEMRGAFRADIQPYLFFCTTITLCDFDQRYRAMLEAAPKPPAGQDGTP